MEKQAKILLVDDDPDFIAATKEVLESQPYEVIVAKNGEEALAAARSLMPDLIILDIIMPRMDGFEACQRLKSDPDLCKIPVCMLTSFGERYMDTSLAMSQGMSLEAEDFIDKPIRPAELLLRVEKLLRKRSDR